MDWLLAVSICQAAVAAGTPILFAALGEILAERVGVLNLGVEGMMLVGAVSGFLVTVRTGSPWMGLLASLAAGGLMALIHAVLSVGLRSNQVVSGLALTLFGTGLSGYLGKPLIGVPAPSTFRAVPLPLLGDVPFLGPVLFDHDYLVYISYLLVPALWFFLYRTRPGLHMRSVGENPAAADAMGINVVGTRYLYTVVGGMLAGAGGAYLSLAYAPTWLENMTGGRGWIAVALVIFAGWNPLAALGGSYLFGGVDALGLRIQAVGTVVPSFFLSMLPYIFTILVLLASGRGKRRLMAPGALGLAYDREGH
jgi:simple sugar transport system permease protein